jgi:hypothetical protein
VKHVVRIIETSGHGRKQVVAAFEINKRGVRGLPGSLLVVMLELIGNIQWVA